MISLKRLPIVILVVFIVSSCTRNDIQPVSITPTKGDIILNTPTPIQSIPIPPSVTAIVSTPDDESQKIQPGVYLVYKKDNDIFAVNDFEEFVLLRQIPDDTFISASPDGTAFAYMENGVINVYNIIDRQKKVIPQPFHSIDTNWWVGAWSYDGKYLIYSIDMVYTEDQTPNLQELPSVYISDFSKSLYSQVTLGNTVETSPSWSPDNQMILFTSDNKKISNGSNFVGATDLFVMPSNCVSEIETCKDTFVKQLTFTGVSGDAINPIWNPMGSDIAFIYVNGQSGDRDIYLVNLDGEVSNLTNTPIQYEDAFSWSPNGEMLVYRRYSPGDGTDLFIYNIKSSLSTRITNTPNTSEGIPIWSPDGKWIAFQQDTDDTNSGILLYSIEMSNSRFLENSTGNKLLFWITIFPSTLPGTILTISPSGHGLNIRSDASIDSQIIGHLNGGEKVEILSILNVEDSYSWWMIRSEAVEGWVAQLYNWYLP